MGRAVLPYKPTWLDKNYRKELDTLNRSQQEECLRLLAELITALKNCKHPIKDPDLSLWRPTPYKGVVKLGSGCHLAEYRLTRTMRVIACYFDSREEILLVAATIKHDHERLKLDAPLGN